MGYKKKLVVFQDITRDDVNKIDLFKSNYPLVVSGLASMVYLLMSSEYENEYIKDWMRELWGIHMNDGKLDICNIRKNIIFHRYQIIDLEKIESMLHTYLNEFAIYRIWNGIYDYVKITDHRFFMKFLIYASVHQRFEKNQMIEMATQYFDYLELQRDTRRTSLIPSYYFEYIIDRSKNELKPFFQRSLHIDTDDDYEPELEIHETCESKETSFHTCNPSPYMWNIHRMMISPTVCFSPRITLDAKSSMEWRESVKTPEPEMMVEEEKTDRVECDEMDKIIHEMMGYIRILYKDEILQNKIVNRILEWKREKTMMSNTDIRNEVLKVVLHEVSSAS